MLGIEEGREGWDTSPAIFALMVTPQAALDEMNLFGAPVTEGELKCALRDCGVETSEAGAGGRLKAEIKAFYDARKDRRLREGYTPLNKGKDKP